MATRGARVVLVDDEGVRATMTASWLQQMGWREVFVLDDGEARGALSEAGAARPLWPAAPTDVTRIAPAALAPMLERDEATLIDLALSSVHRQRHIRGAQWAIRARHEEWLALWPAGRPLVLTSEDGRLAEFAAADLATIANGPVYALEGGTAAWERAGFALESGFDAAQEPPDDMWHIPSSAQGGGERAMKQYLAWEVDLVKQLAGEPGVDFAFPTPGSRPRQPAARFTRSPRERCNERIARSRRRDRGLPAGALVATRDVRRPARRQPAVAPVRGGPLGAFFNQLAAVALRLCAPRHAGVGADLRSADRSQQALGEERGGAGGRAVG
jgi:rhodanese-related sulfurtransferase